MLSDTESSFNKITKEIINSPLCGAYAFIEKVSDPPPQRIARAPHEGGKITMKKIKTQDEQTKHDINKMDQESQHTQIYHIDLNKNRKNILILK